MDCPEDQWLKLSCDCPAPLAEAVADRLGILSGCGVEQTPEDSGSVQISGFFSLSAQDDPKRIVTRVRAELEEVFRLYGHQPPVVHSTTLADQDWATSWQRFFRPFAIIPGLVIKPSWEQYRPADGEQVLEIDPGMAFGTGQHSSTRMALELMAGAFHHHRISTVLDVGTGTGILAMGAVLLGARRVEAIDNDPEAVAAARKNILANGLEASIRVSATPLEQLAGPVDLILANIVHDVLVSMAGDLTRLLLPGGFLVLAGILTGEQEHSIRTTYEQQGMKICTARHDREWAALLLCSEPENPDR